MTIWKFQLRMTDVQSIDVPTGGKFLSLQVQDGVPCVWALVDPDHPREPRAIRIYGTGHSISQIGQFLGTFQVQAGAFVFHVFAV